jgi:hypothetical protein
VIQIPVSALWNVTVFRPISTPQTKAISLAPKSSFSLLDDSARPPTKLQYKLFLTPVQDADAALEFLKGLPRSDSPAKIPLTHLKQQKQSDKRRSDILADQIVTMCVMRSSSRLDARSIHSLDAGGLLPTVTVSILRLCDSSVHIGWCISAHNNNDRDDDGAVTLQVVNRAAEREFTSRVANRTKTSSFKQHSASRMQRVVNKKAARSQCEQFHNSTQSAASSLDCDGCPAKYTFVVCVDLKVNDDDRDNKQYKLGGQRTLLPYRWERVYDGVGDGCAVNGLRSLSAYAFRIRLVCKTTNTTNRVDKNASLVSSDIAHGYIHIHTTNEPLSRGPQIISKFEHAASSTAQRQGRYPRSSNAGARAKLLAAKADEFFLPPGCMFVIEGAINEDFDPELGDGSGSVWDGGLDEGNLPVDWDELQWEILSKATSAEQWIGGEFCGKQLILSTSIINQDGIKGPRSRTYTVVNVPEFGLKT